jgi:DUF4097 and DUF4098 domain-containing protein YvlB
MSNGRRRSPSLFSGIVLILIGVLFLLHYFRGDFPSLWELLTRWWPLLLILWGVVRLIERMAPRQPGETPPPAVRGGEILLVLAVCALIGAVALREWIPRHVPGNDLPGMLGANKYTYDVDVAPKPAPPGAHITVRTTHGSITVRTEDTAQILVTAKKTIRTWDDGEAQRLAAPVTVVIEQTGESFDVHPQGQAGNERVGVDLEVRVPRKAVLTVRDEHGDIQVNGAEGSLSVNGQHGNVEIRDSSDVSVDMNRGDVKVSDTKGNVKISGTGDQVEVLNASGSMTLNGEFFGPIRAEKIAKGVRYVAQRTDLTVSQLSGHLETGSGNLEVFDAPGNVILQTSSKDITMENVTGKLQIVNRAGNIELRFLQPPKEDVTVTNESAGINLTMPSNSSFEIQADSHSGAVECEFTGDSLKQANDDQGNGHLAGKIGARGPKIILKTTYGSISIHKSS